MTKSFLKQNEHISCSVFNIVATAEISQQILILYNIGDRYHLLYGGLLGKRQNDNVCNSDFF